MTTQETGAPETSAPQITLEEQEKILLTAEGYLREPESWTVGKWKCPLYEVKDGKFVRDPRTLDLVQAKDDNGRALHQYCVEGAVNQATVDVLGEERAELLGVDVSCSTGGGEMVSNESRGFDPTRLMELDRIAFELYSDKMDWGSDFDSTMSYAMLFNDCWEDDGEESYDDEGAALPPKASPEGHEGVLNIVRTRLKEVRAALKARS